MVQVGIFLRHGTAIVFSPIFVRAMYVIGYSCNTIVSYM